MSQLTLCLKAHYDVDFESPGTSHFSPMISQTFLRLTSSRRRRIVFAMMESFSATGWEKAESKADLITIKGCPTVSICSLPWTLPMKWWQE